MILAGTRDAVLLQLRLLDVHGTFYYDVTYVHTDDQQQRHARIGKEDMYEAPQPGDAVRVRYTMNVVTSVERRDDAEG
jgi:hypothetical protein